MTTNIDKTENHIREVWYCPACGNQPTIEQITVPDGNCTVVECDICGFSGRVWW